MSGLSPVRHSRSAKPSMRKAPGGNAGGRGLVQRAGGYRAAVVSGVVTFENGVATGELVRGPRAAPALLAAD